MLAPGRQLGPYEIVQPVGTGGMGEVYRARDTRLGRTVAIKVLRLDAANLPDMRSRLMHEARVIASLNHPHIGMLFDVGSVEGLDYLIMEYIEGQTLATALKQGRLPVALVLKYGIQIADALVAAHDAGVLHRDLKPANVMITPEGRVKVLDFGIAKRLFQAGTADTLTMGLTDTGAIVGTLSYIAPEVLQGRPADMRSDIWSFGTILHEAATGTPLFSGRTPVEVISAILHPSPTPLPAEIPRRLRIAVRRCLEKDPANRFQSAAELRAAVSILGDVLAGVAFAHDRQIVHRDLSPSNILMTTTGICKIGDFGIATTVGEPSHGGTGNPNYMSPEQQRGDVPDQSSDLFMVGIIGYMLLAGRHPYAHSSGLFTIPELIGDENYIPETPRPPAAFTTSQQRQFREYSALVMRLFNRERAGRFANAREALSALEAVTPSQECPHCGERLPEHFQFCGYCGQKIESGQTEKQPVSVAAPEPTVDELIEQGFAFSRQRRWEDAIAQYEKALKLDSKNQKALRNLGYVLNQAGQHERAETVLSEGLLLETEVPSHEASLLHERAVARAELKKYEEALSDANRALSLLHHSVKTRYLRARIHLYSGSREEAKRDAQEVLRAVPDHNGALRLLSQVG